MMRRGSTYLLLATLVVGSTPAWADRKPNKSGSSPVRYTKLDASTLRVFALGTVGVAPLEGSDLPIQVATPQAGHGTGFAVEPDLIITAQHVVKGARHVVIRLPGNGGYLPARVVYGNEDDDIAVLHVDAKLPQIKMRESEYTLRVRQTVFAVGYPIDPSRTQAQSARGIIAGHLDDASLQLDISLNPGNSGGPLVDEKDQAVGMVIARGDVKRGVQGIGWAVPIRKLRVAMARAHRAIGSGKIAPLSEHDALTARVVDELVGSGTLSFGADLASGLDKRGIERTIDVLVDKLDDADLLVFLAGNLWNAALAIETRKVRAVAGKPLSRTEAETWARDLKRAALRLTQRGVELDRSIRDRSKFVELALADDSTDTIDATDGGSRLDPDDPDADRQHVSAPLAGLSVDGVAGTGAREQRMLRWTIQTSPELRLATDRAFGGELDVHYKLITGSGTSVRPFGSIGASAGLSIDGSTMRSGQSFAAAEVGGGISVRVSRTSSLELYGGVAPSYYAVMPDLGSPMTRESSFVLDHFHAAASLAVGWLNISAGVRSIHSTVWVEPIGLGINF